MQTSYLVRREHSHLSGCWMISGIRLIVRTSFFQWLMNLLLNAPFLFTCVQIYQWSNTLIIFAGLLLNCVAFGCLYRPLKPAVTLKSLSTTYLPEELEAIKIEDIDSSGIFVNESLRASQSIFLSNGRIVKPLIQLNEAMEIENDNLSDVPCDPGILNDVCKSSIVVFGKQPSSAFEETYSFERKIFPPEINSEQDATLLSSSAEVANCDESGKDKQTFSLTEHVLQGHFETAAMGNVLNPNGRCTMTKNTEHHIDIHKNNAPDFLPKAAEKTKCGSQTCHSPNFVSNDTNVKNYQIFKRGPTGACIISTPCLPSNIYQDLLSCKPAGWSSRSDGIAKGKTSNGLLSTSCCEQQTPHLKLPYNQSVDNTTGPVDTKSSPLLSPSNSDLFITKKAMQFNRIHLSTIFANELHQSVTAKVLSSEGQLHKRLFQNSAIILGSYVNGSPISERKIEMAILGSKPTLVLLPHPEITISDYRRPFYRSDIFYGKNVPLKPVSFISATPNSHSKTMRSHTFDTTIPRIKCNSRNESLNTFTDVEVSEEVLEECSADRIDSQRRWHGSLLLSLTNIPVSNERDMEKSRYSEYVQSNLHKADMDYKDVNDASCLENCFTCIRRIRDRIIFYPLSKTIRVEHQSEKYYQVESKLTMKKKTWLSNFRQFCFRKAFCDVVHIMTDIGLLKNRGYLLVFIANFFALLGVTSIVGRLGFAWLSSRIAVSPIVLQTVTQILLGLTTALMPFQSDFKSQAAAFAMHGLLSGPLASLSTTILCELVDLDELTTAVGLITLSRGIASGIGPPLAGNVYSVTFLQQACHASKKKPEGLQATRKSMLLKILEKSLLFSTPVSVCMSFSALLFRLHL
ncbi:hypothetical protein PHET_05574 [Paragonimus heterotremus]|uniref:Uncharacterized protein n=1 Tax=Paragonimus heterotremus TaxID=100268 RepID=A0A8J4TAF4_9TREM|nr:hypothetical protein PHET_05574 [Paragonimus heterotremus]